MKSVTDLAGIVAATTVALAIVYGAFFAITKETCDEGQTKVSYTVEGTYREVKQSCVATQDAIPFIERQRAANGGR